MGKLSDKAPNNQWDTRIADLVDRTIRIDSMEKVKLSLGYAYVANVAILGDSGTEQGRCKALLSGGVVCEKLDRYMEATEGDPGRFPFVAAVMQVTAKGGRQYYVILDPDEVADFAAE
jgi:hypothetical protein